MRGKIVVFAMLLLVALVTRPLSAQTSDRDDVFSAIDARLAEEEHARERIRRVLGTAEVAEMAGRLGVDAGDLNDRVEILSGEDLRVAAERTSLLEDALQDRTTISFKTTTLIIILLLTIILILIV